MDPISIGLAALSTLDVVSKLIRDAIELSRQKDDVAALAKLDEAFSMYDAGGPEIRRLLDEGRAELHARIAAGKRLDP